MAAILMTMFLELTQPRRKRMETECHLSALPRIQEFLKSFAADNGWAQAMRNRLDAAVEETLATLFHRGDSAENARAAPTCSWWHSRRTAAPSWNSLPRAETSRISRIESPCWADTPKVRRVEREISLRLLRHVASSIRHQQYHNTDIVTIRVKAPEPKADQPSASGSGKPE